MNTSKRYFILTFFLSTVVLFSACHNEKTVTEQIPIVQEVEEEEMAEEVVEIVESEEVAQPISDEPVTVTGYFRSVRGVMDKLSCYCGNGGYLESPAGQTFAVCLNDALTFPNGAIVEVTGKQEMKSIESNGGPCPSGVMTFIRVDSYKIMSE